MLLKLIPEAEKIMMNDWIDKYAYKTNVNTERCSLDYLLRIWNYSKVRLFKLLGNKLMHKEKITFETPSEAIEQKINALAKKSPFIEWFSDDYCAKIPYEHGKTWQYYTLISSTALAKNKFDKESVIYPLPNGKTIKAMCGCRPMRILARIAKAYRKEKEFEEFRIQHSQILNQKEMHGELVLSIHPFDYMTMSDNNSNWSSCMSWREDGCYRRGTIEMMNSYCVLMAYLKSEKTQMGSWNNKKWRELFIVNEDIISGIKGYPYNSDELTKKCIEIIARLSKENLNAQYEEEIIKYTPFTCFTHNGGEYEFEFDTHTMYNDMENIEHAYCALSEYCLPGFYIIDYSGENQCVHCGETWDKYHFHNEEYLVCDYCANRHTCYYCEELFSKEDLYKVNGNYVCEDCYNNYVVETADTGSEYFKHEVFAVHLFKNGLMSNNVIYLEHLVLDEEFSQKYFPNLKEIRIKQEAFYQKIYYVSYKDCSKEGLELFGYSQSDE